MKTENDKIIFSSGKVIGAYAGVIGIGQEPQGIYGGYDEVIYEADFAELTKDEKIEIADYMIGQWQKFKGNA